MAGKGENKPTVQSAFNGHYYVRSIPSDEYGTAGKTQVFQVTSDVDKLLDEYPVYMRGELYLGWSPITGKWCLVHLEPERITSSSDFKKRGKVSRLAFYMGGKELCTYSGAALDKLGLNDKAQPRIDGQSRQFTVHGIMQIPRTNHYVFSIKKPSETGAGTDTISLDITTGKIFVEDSVKNTEPIVPVDGPPFR